MPKLKIVDGWKIRNTIDLDFSCIEDSLATPCVPKNEIWFDRGFMKEKKSIVATFLKKRSLMKKYPYAKVRKMLLTKAKHSADEVKIQQIGKRGPIKIWLVSGKKVREYFDYNFVFGGHWLVYKYVPKNEVWIDDATLTKEKKYVLIHELYELNLMKKGMHYNNAHDYACAREKEERRKDGVAEYLKD